MQDAANRQLELPGTIIDPKMFDGEESVQLVDQAKRLVEVHRRKQKLVAQLEEVQQQYNLEEELLLKIMERDGVDSMRLGSSAVSSRTTTYVSVNKYNEKAAHKWLAEQGYDSLIKETVNSRTLTGAYKEMLEHDIEMPSDLFNINPKQRVAITKARRG